VLVSEGLIERKQWSGTFVSGLPVTTYVAMLANADALSAMSGHYLRTIVSAARDHIEGSGHRVLPAFGHGTADEEILDSVQLLTRPVTKGLVGILSTVRVETVSELIEQAGIPLVSIDLGTASSRYAVVLDLARMADIAAEQMRARGYEDFAVMSHAQVDEASGGMEGPCAASWLGRAFAALPPDRVITIRWSWDMADAYHAFKRAWSRPDRPRAVFFADDAICDAATRAILELGIKVPEELGVITHANAGRHFHFPLPLARIEFDPAQAVAMAWDMREKLLAGQTLEEPVRSVLPQWREGRSI